MRLLLIDRENRIQRAGRTSRISAGIVLAVGLLAPSLYLTAQTRADEAASLPVQATGTDHVNFAPGGTIRINDSFGYLNVQGWDRPDVELTVTKSTPSRHGPKGRQETTKRLEHFRVVTERPSNAELVISTVPSSHGLVARSKRGVLIEYQIRAPRDTKLVIHHDSGYVLVTDMTTDIEATARYGDLVLMLPHLEAYSVDAKTGFGGVSSDYADAARRLHLIGARFDHAAATPAHRLYLRMGMGGITIKDIPPKPEAPMAAGGE